MSTGIRIHKRPGDDWQRGVQFRRAQTPSGWTYWRDEWATKAAAELRLAAYRAQGYSGHTFEIEGLTLVDRRVWGARPPKASPTHDDWTHAPLVWHHTADTYSGGNRATNVDHAQAMQYFHQHVRDWNDIAYNYIVFPNGDVFEGRGFGVRGAGAANPDTGEAWNRGYIHVAFAGDFTRQSVTPAASAAADELVIYLRNRGASIPNQHAHGDLMPTACPGRGVRQDRGL